MQLLLSLEQSSFKLFGILLFHARLFDKFGNHDVHSGRVVQSTFPNETESGGGNVPIDVGKPLVLLLAPWRSAVVFPDDVPQPALRLGINPQMFIVSPPKRDNTTNGPWLHLVQSEKLLVAFLLPPLIWIFPFFESCYNRNNRNMLSTDNLVEQIPIDCCVLPEPPSRTIDKQADAVEPSNERVQFFDCLPMRNPSLVAFIETGCVIDTEEGVFNDCSILVVLEGATTSAVRHLGDLFTYNHVHEGALSRACFAEKDNVMNLKLKEMESLFAKPASDAPLAVVSRCIFQLQYYL